MSGLDFDEMAREHREKRAARLLKQREEQLDVEKTKALASKKCGKCKLGVPQVEFAKHYRAKDGLQGWCKGCLAEASKQGGAPKHKITAVELAKFMKMQRDFMESFFEVDKVTSA